MPTNSILKTAPVRAVLRSDRRGDRPLGRLEAFAEPRTSLGGPFGGQPMAPWGHADPLAAAAFGGPPSKKDSTRFWVRGGRLHAELNDIAFLEAFLDEALSVWAAVPSPDE